MDNTHETACCSLYHLALTISNGWQMGSEYLKVEPSKIDNDIVSFLEKVEPR